MNFCRNCKEPLSNNYNKFCNRSCAATFNNKNRIISEEHRAKVRESIKRKIKENGLWGCIKEPSKKYCINCKKEIDHSLHRKTCSDNCFYNYLSISSKKHKTGGYKPGSGRGKHGWYDDIYFDSTYELAFYLYCKNKGIEIKKCKDSFKYIDSYGKERTYHPDFRVNGKLTEIKGFYTKEVKNKLSSVNEPIDIYYKKDLKDIFQYVEKLTGKKIHKLYELYLRT